MIVVSMDIANGRVVNVSGDTGEVSDAGAPEEMIPRYALPGEVALVDLDAAAGRGENRKLITSLVRDYPCRVGGGIRSVSEAVGWLDAGAEKVVVDATVERSVFDDLPKSRTLAAVDVKNGEVITYAGSVSPEERILALKDQVSGFVFTFLDKRGCGTGVDISIIKKMKEAAGKRCSFTVAGGIATAPQIAELDKLDVDAQVGRAIHTGELDLADAIVAPIKTDRPDGLFATIVVDELGQAIGLVYSDMESIREAVKRKMGAYHSRSRGLWVKGLTSGNTQELLGVRLDCDRDALIIQVTQTGAGFCHKDTWTCWGEDNGIGWVSRELRRRESEKAAGAEPMDAVDKDAVIDDAADTLMATLSTMAKAGVSFKEVEQRLYKKSLRVSARKKER